MYETGTSIRARAYHVMAGLPPPEGERHAHDYRIEAVASRDDLDEQGMVVDLDLLDTALRTVAAELDGADLETVIDGADTVTVEVLAHWVHNRLGAALSPMPGLGLSVRVWESTVAFGGYAAPLTGVEPPHLRTSSG